MKKMFKILSIPVIAAFFGFFLIFASFELPTKAKTTVSIDDCKIKITIDIAITGEGANQTYADKIKKVAEKKWNEAKIKAGDCKCELDLTINVIVVRNCDDPKAKDHHCVTINKVATGTFHRSTVTGTASAWGQASGDPPSAEINSGTGNWGNKDSDQTIAHEVGHLMGLDDEYTDGYYYCYKKADGTCQGGLHFVAKKDFTSAKKQEIENNKPAGTTVKYFTNPETGFVWSKPNAGKEKSLMASIAADAVPQDDHAADILGDTNLKCPNECCCGDGKVDKDKGEQCDPKANPSGCKEGEQVCTSNCKCAVLTPMCGDGFLNGREECDPKADPTGCEDNEICMNDCTCFGPDDIEDPPEGETEPLDTGLDSGELEVTTPPPGQECGDGLITGNEQCDPEASPIGCQTGYECFDCYCVYIEITSDSDNDGIEDENDNCPNVSNPNQEDDDEDGIGNKCDPCTDKDKDGYSQEGGNCGLIDCDDLNSSINPGIEEICNDNLDNNCDGLIDNNCNPPLIDVLPPAINFDFSITEIPLTIINAGGEMLYWQIISNLPSWLNVSSYSGSTTPGSESLIIVSINTEGLVPGFYEYVININSDGGNRNIPVTLAY